VKHTQTPWKINENPFVIRDNKGEMSIGRVNKTTDAKYIVKCVNAHDELMEFVEILVNNMGVTTNGDTNLFIEAKKLLAKYKESK